MQVFTIHNKLCAEVHYYYNTQMKKKIFNSINLGRYELKEIGLKVEVDTNGVPKLHPPSFSYRLTIGVCMLYISARFKISVITFFR